MQVTEHFVDAGGSKIWHREAGLVTSDAITGRRRIEMPTLIVWGMRDPALPPKLLEGMKRDIPHAEVVELPECGHFAPEEDPQALADAIAAFATSD